MLPFSCYYLSLKDKTQNFMNQEMKIPGLQDVSLLVVKFDT